MIKVLKSNNYFVVSLSHNLIVRFATTGRKGVIYLIEYSISYPLISYHDTISRGVILDPPERYSLGNY